MVQKGRRAIRSRETRDMEAVRPDAGSEGESPGGNPSR